MRTDRILEHSDWQRESYRRFLAGHLLRHGLSPAALQNDPKGQVLAEINRGRWIAKCPNPGCGGALVVTATDPIFLCTECGSEDNGGQPYRVKFPAQRKAIEAALMARPLVARKPLSRNWLPHEKVADLLRENEERGIR